MAAMLRRIAIVGEFAFDQAWQEFAIECAASGEASAEAPWGSQVLQAVAATRAPRRRFLTR